MKNRKMALSLLLCLVMIAPLWAAGRSSSGSAGATTGKADLTFWSLFSGGDGDIITSMVDKYNSENNKARIEMTILKSEEYYSKLILSMATRDASDIAVSHLSSLMEFVAEDYLYPLDSLASDAGLNWKEFTDRLAEGVLFNGRHVAVPIDTHVFLMHYNTKILGGLGMLDAEKRPTFRQNRDDFIRYFREVKGKLPSNMMPISGTSQGELPLYMWYSFYTQQGGKLISSDGKKATLDNQQNLNALNLMHQMVTENLWPKAQQSGSQIFTAQQAAATFNGNWGIPIFEGTAGLEFISLPFPQLFEQQSVFADSHTLILPRQKRDDPVKQKAAMDFMNWMANNTVMWAKAGHIPSKTAVVDSAQFKALPYRSGYAKSAEYATFYPKTTIITGMKESFRNLFAAFIAGEYDVQQTHRLMQSEVQRLLDK